MANHLWWLENRRKEMRIYKYKVVIVSKTYLFFVIASIIKYFYTKLIVWLNKCWMESNFLISRDKSEKISFYPLKQKLFIGYNLDGISVKAVKL
jgi:hypothetical protein